MTRTAVAAPAAPEPQDDDQVRQVLLWQVVDLLRQLAWVRVFWATMDPQVYGVWMADQ